MTRIVYSTLARQPSTTLKGNPEPGREIQIILPQRNLNTPPLPSNMLIISHPHEKLPGNRRNLRYWNRLLPSEHCSESGSESDQIWADEVTELCCRDKHVHPVLSVLITSITIMVMIVSGRRTSRCRCRTQIKIQRSVSCAFVSTLSPLFF